MSSIVRPTTAQMTRRLFVLAAVVFAIVIAYAQMAFGWGQTPSEFSADSDATLRVASYAFSIWGLIYLALLVYAVRQALPQTGESRPIHRLGWPSLLAFLGIGWWIVASAFDREWATVALIFGSLLVLLIPMLTEAGTIRALDRADRDRWTVVWPLGLLAGWLTVASPVNLLTVLTGNGDLPEALSPDIWALIAVGVVAVVAVLVTARVRTLAYPLPIAWGLLGVFVAELERGREMVAYGALVAAVAVLVAAVVLAALAAIGAHRALR